MLGLSDAGEPNLTLYDTKEQPRATIFVTTADSPILELSGGTLVICDAHDKRRIILGFGRVGEPALWLNDAWEKPGIVVGFNDEREAGIWLYGEEIEPPSLSDSAGTTAE